MMMRALHVAAICAALMLGACSDHPQPPGDPLDPDPPGAEPVVLVGAGDIAACNSDGDEATAKLLDEINGTVITLGDNAYPDGRASDFSQCYEPGWGRHLQDPTNPRKPRLPQQRRGALLRLFRCPCRTSWGGLLAAALWPTGTGLCSPRGRCTDPLQTCGPCSPSCTRLERT